MSPDTELIEKLTTLNHIAETLNRAVDVRGVLNDALAHLVELMGLETGWIFLKDPAAQGKQWGSGYVLAAHCNLPPALALDNEGAWEGGCLCQTLCDEACQTEAYNEVHCSRLASVGGDRRGLAMHASTPLRSGGHSLGILNVAGHDWSSFSPQALTLLTNVGSQIGVALERARLFDLLQERRIHEQAALLDFSNQLLGRLDLDDLMGFLVEQVRQMVGVDASALLLPGEEQGSLEFRAASGWRQDPVAEGRWAPAGERSGPGLVIHTQRPLIEEDLAEEATAPWAPGWLRAEGFRGHVVVPLIAGGGSVGALVINRRQPWLPDEGEMRLLHLMANQAAIAIEKARLIEEEVKGQALEKDLALGRQIQLSLLPKSPPVVPGWEFAAFYQPARLVGGDFYDHFELPGELPRLGVVIADVVGKGVPAALFMALSRTLIRTAALSGLSPAATLQRANELILKDSGSDLFLTASYAMLDTSSGRVVYANGGHNPALWLQAKAGEIQELSAPGIALGALRAIKLEQGEIEVAPGDALVFYTDGVTEAMDASHRLFDSERLRSVVAANPGASAQRLLDEIVEAVQAFTGDAPQSDDLTAFVVRRCP